MTTPETKPNVPNPRFVEAYQRADRLMAMLPEEREKRFDPVWRDFFALTAIPRASGREELAGQFLEHVGQERGYATERDTVGNVLWRIPATSQKLAHPKFSTLNQVHQDMVSKGQPDPAMHGVEPEVVKTNNSWFVQSKNNQTTLGADNGIMVALAMQLPKLLEGKPHGDLAVLFNVDEEQGLKGAKALDFNLDKYGHYLNLDSEEDHEITIGSAATGDSFIDVPVTRVPIGDAMHAFSLMGEGFKGGHSGIKIGDDTRKNTIKQLVDLTAQANDDGAHFTIASAYANGPMNAIPDSAEITLVGNKKDEELLQRLMAAKQETLIGIESQAAKLSLSPTKAVSTLDEKSSGNLLALLSKLPHGVMEKESYDESLVKTSTNLARFNLAPDAQVAQIGMMSRSSDNAAIKHLRESTIEDVVTSHGATISHLDASPAWEPVKDGDLALLISSTHQDLFGKPMRQVTTHGGLETSYIILKYPQFKGHIASIGANVNNAHEIQENTEGPSVEKTIKLVTEVITRLTQKSPRRKH